MPPDTATDPDTAGALQAAQSRLLISGVLVLAATVTLAVWGPALQIPGLHDDARSWAAGAMLIGGLLLLTLHGLMLRPLGRLARQGRLSRRSADVAAVAAAAPTAPDTDAVAAERQLRAAAERTATRLRSQLRALIEALPQGVALSFDRRFELSNTAFRETMGWSLGELHGRSPYEVFSSVNRDDVLGQALREAFSAGRGYEAELDFRRRDGATFKARLHCRQVEPGDPGAGTLWLLRPQRQPQPATAEAPVVAAQPQLQSQLQPQPPEARTESPASPADRDPLTGLLNAAAFQRDVARWLLRAGGEQSASLLLIDLDRFKRINEAAGRGAGDRLLREAAAVLQAQVRDGDAVARLEDDTYAMLLPGCAAATALQMGERLRAALGALGVDHEGHRLGVGATVGVAERNSNSNSNSAGGAADPAAAWLARARAAWYEAKYGGRGAVRLAAQTPAVPLVVPA